MSLVGVSRSTSALASLKLQVKYNDGMATVWLPSSHPILKEKDFLQIEALISHTHLYSVNITSNPMILPLVNIRQPVIFKYFRRSGESPSSAVSRSSMSPLAVKVNAIMGTKTGNKIAASSFGYGRSNKAITPPSPSDLVLALSDPLYFNSQEPQQGHLTFTNVPGEMTITWVSNATQNPEVQWGFAPLQSALVHSAPAHGITYSIKDMCAAPANDPQNFLDPGMIYTALMSQLPTGRLLYYRYGSAIDGWSDIHSFHIVNGKQEASSRPAAGGVFNFTAFGDMGVDPDQPPAALSTAHILEHINETDMVLHIGDISYARGHAYIWESFFHEIQPFATRVPYMTSIGNHEYDYHGQPFHPPWSTYGSDSGGEVIKWRAKLGK